MSSSSTTPSLSRRLFPWSKPRSSLRRDASNTRHDASRLADYSRISPSPVKALEPEVDHERDDLNASLAILLDVFPHVRPGVIREMLRKLSRHSRREIVALHVLENNIGALDHDQSRKNPDAEQLILPPEACFRSKVYRTAVKNALVLEFPHLNRSIDGVLAETNQCYSQARPLLQSLQHKSWRTFFASILGMKPHTAGHPMLICRDGDSVPALVSTTSKEFDDELHRTLIAPLLLQVRATQIAADTQIAMTLHEREAQESGALYDCECCCAATTFERLVVCNDSQHYICHACIQSTLKEALFGQGWTKSVIVTTCAVRCIAPSHDECTGAVSGDLLRYAIESGSDGVQLWRKFEQRIAREELRHSGMPILQCPFCPFAIFDAPRVMTFKSPLSFATTVIRPAYRWQSPSRRLSPALIMLLAILAVLLQPLFTFALLVTEYFQVTPTRASLLRVTHRKRGLRFTCQAPDCGVGSCTLCSARWTDPHTCYETSLTSLRQAVEAATTAAVKRTCPRCGLSFVKESGCNKMVCACGHAMCYVCRAIIASPKTAQGYARRIERVDEIYQLGDDGHNERVAGDGDGDAEEAGYAHFCTHFKPAGDGRPCDECDKCGLYADEDSDAVVQRAAKIAEANWLRESRSTMESCKDTALQSQDTSSRNGLHKVSRGAADQVTAQVLGTKNVRGQNGWKAVSRMDWSAWLDHVIDALLI